MAISGPPADRGGIQKGYAIGYAYEKPYQASRGTDAQHESLGGIRHKGLANVLQINALRMVARRGSARQLTIEREVEYTKGPGHAVCWKAYGLEEIQLTVAPTVYPPREDTVLLDRVLAEQGFGRGRRLLEIGCGSGAIALSSSTRGWEVLACDINPLAVATTIGNASANDCKITQVSEGGPGDGVAWFPEKGVDVIAWNLPYLDPAPGEKLGPLEESALVEQQGELELLRVLDDEPWLLNRGGVVYLIHSSNQLGARIPQLWRKSGWATRNLSSVRVGDELLTAIACWRPFEDAEIIRLESCESTNDEILEGEGVSQGTLVVSANQISGRGYRGREWIGQKGNLMGSWKLPDDSINRSPSDLQFAACLSVMDTLSVFLNLGLPSHSWVHCSALESAGIRVKWPNDIWLRTKETVGKMCGILVQGRTKGRQSTVALGIGLNREPITGIDKTMGWNELVDIEVEELIPVIHASIASTLEVHPMVNELPTHEILSSFFAGMRMTLCEGEPESFGIASDGRLLGINGTTELNEEWRWVWN